MKFQRRLKFLAPLLPVLGLLIFGFQNCGKMLQARSGPNGMPANVHTQLQSASLTSANSLIDEKRHYHVAKPFIRDSPYDNPFTRFLPGANHITGSYAFNKDKNYLNEGVDKIFELGSQSVMLYLGPLYASRYPDQNSNQWAQTATPRNLSELIDTAPYKNAMDKPFQLFGFWAFTFSNNDNVVGMSTNKELTDREENEFYELTKKIMLRYQNTGKIFILKNWESDNALAGLGKTDIGVSLNENVVPDFVGWLVARQRGVERARKELSYLRNVWVYNAVDINKADLVPATAKLHGVVKKRAINMVVPLVKADMVSYSAWDSQVYGNIVNGGITPNSQAVREVLTAALAVIDQNAPDPMKLGRRRILISEFGNTENDKTNIDSSEIWRTQAVLSTAANFGISAAFYWQLYDNECNINGVSGYGKIYTGPAGSNPMVCPQGYWLIKTDGTQGKALGVMKKWWDEVPAAYSQWHDDNINFVNFIYYNLLGRKPDQTGLDFWLRSLDQAEMTRKTVLNYFVDYSRETSIGDSLSNSDFIVSLYNTLLSGDPDPGGLAYWTTRLLPFPNVSQRGPLMHEFADNYVIYHHPDWYKVGSVNCTTPTAGLNDEISKGDPRFLCANGRWHECGWELSDSSWVTKTFNNERVGSYFCNLSARMWLRTEGTADCTIVSPGKHNTVGTSNGDTRFLCFNGRWHDCGWERNDPNWETKATQNQIVGIFSCNLARGQWDKLIFN